LERKGKEGRGGPRSRAIVRRICIHREEGAAFREARKEGVKKLQPRRHWNEKKKERETPVLKEKKIDAAQTTKISGRKKGGKK